MNVFEIKGLFATFEALRERHETQLRVKARDLFEVFDQRQMNFVATGCAEFNVFSILQFGADEVRHTQILAWLLDARESHGQGDLFSELFSFHRVFNIPTNR